MEQNTKTRLLIVNLLVHDLWMYFAHNYHIKKITVQVYILPSMFIKVSKNTKQTSE
jgi:hypothetical protein